MAESSWRNLYGRTSSLPETKDGISVPSETKDTIVDRVMGPSSPPESRWLRESELKIFLKEVDLSRIDEGEPNSGGIPLWSDGKRTYVDNSMNHSMIIAMTNSHKTRGFVLPMVYSLVKGRESMVIHDPKGEILSHTHDLLEENGYRIRILNLRDPMKGDHWNMLSYPYEVWHSGDKNRAREMITDIASNMLPIKSKSEPFWDDAGQRTLLGLLYLLMERATKEEVNFMSIAVLLGMIKNDSDKLTKLIRSMDPDSIEASQLSVCVSNADNTRRCIFSMVDDAIATMVSREDVLSMMSTNDITMDDIGTRKTAIFLVTADEKETLNPIVGRFVVQLNTKLIEKAQELGGSLPVRVNVILDEMASLKNIDNIPNMMAAARSRNIRYTMVIQSTSQLESIYGKKNADTIMNNSANLIFLNGRDEEFLKKLCYLCGSDKNGNPLVTTTQLMHLMKGREALIISDRNYPFITRITDISKYDVKVFDRYEPEVRFKLCKPAVIDESFLERPKPKTKKEVRADVDIDDICSYGNSDADDSDDDSDEDDDDEDLDKVLRELFGEGYMISSETTFFDMDTIIEEFSKWSEGKCELTSLGALKILDFSEILCGKIQSSELFDSIKAVKNDDDGPFKLKIRHRSAIKPSAYGKCDDVIKEMIEVVGGSMSDE